MGVQLRVHTRETTRMDLQQDDVWDVPQFTPAKLLSSAKTADDQRRIEHFITSTLKKDVTSQVFVHSWELEGSSANRTDDPESQSDLAQSLLQDKSAWGSVNWLHRLCHALRQTLRLRAGTEQVALEGRYAREGELFHQAGEAYAKLLITALMGGTGYGPSILGFRRLTKTRYPEVYELHCPKFDHDYVFAIDSICLTLINGGSVFYRSADDTLNSAVVSRDDAIKLYKNDVKGGQAVADAVLRMSQSSLRIYPPHAGLVRLGDMAVYYEPLLYPTTIPVKTRTANMLENQTDWWRARGFICADADHPPASTATPPLQWVIAGRLEQQDPLMSHLLKDLPLPLGTSDLLPLLTADRSNTYLTSMDCALFWTNIEGENGLMYMRNLTEVLPPILQQSVLEQFPPLPAPRSTDDPWQNRFRPVPPGLLRRVPMTAALQTTRYACTMVALSRKQPDKEDDGTARRFRQILEHQIVNMFVDAPFDPDRFRRWFKAHGLKTREVYKWLREWDGVAEPLLRAVERDMVAKVVKRVFEHELAVERAQYLQSTQKRGRLSNDSSRLVQSAHFVSQTSAFVEHMDMWMVNFVHKVLNEGDLWTEKICPAFLQMYGPPPLDHHAFLGGLSRMHFAAALANRTGLSLDAKGVGHSSPEMHPSMRAFCDRVGKKLLCSDAGDDKLSFEDSWRRQMLGASVEPPAMDQVAVGMLSLRGLDIRTARCQPVATVSVREAMFSLNQYCAQRLSEATSFTCKSVKPILRVHCSLPVTAGLSPDCFVDLFMHAGVMGSLRAALQERPFPCLPACPPDPELPKGGSRECCRRFHTAAQALECLCAVRPSMVDWRHVLLIYGYICLQHDHLLEGYLIAKNLIEEGYQPHAKLLMFQVLVRSTSKGEETTSTLDRMVGAHKSLNQAFRAGIESIAPTASMETKLEAYFQSPTLPQSGWQVHALGSDLVLLYGLLRACGRTTTLSSPVATTLTLLAENSVVNARRAFMKLAGDGPHWLEMVALRLRVLAYQSLHIAGKAARSQVIAALIELVDQGSRAYSVPQHAWARDLLQLCELEAVENDVVDDDGSNDAIKVVGSRIPWQPGRMRPLPVQAWQAACYLDETVGVAHPLTLKAMVCTGRCLQRACLTSWRAHTPQYTKLKTKLLSAVLDDGGLDVEVHRQMLQVWWDPRPKQKATLAIDCFYKCFLRIAARLRMCSFVQAVPVVGHDGKVTAFTLPPQETEESLVKLLFAVTRDILLLKALALTPEQELKVTQRLRLSLLSRAQQSAVTLRIKDLMSGAQQEQTCGHDAPTTPSESLGSLGEEVIGLLHIFQTLDGINDPNDAARRAVLQCWMWCLPDLIRPRMLPADLARYENELDATCALRAWFRSPNPDVLDNPMTAKSPQFWFDTQLYGMGVEAVTSSNLQRAKHYPVLQQQWNSELAFKVFLHLLLLSHCTEDLKVKWIMHYLASAHQSGTKKKQQAASIPVPSRSCDYDKYLSSLDLGRLQGFGEATPQQLTPKMHIPPYLVGLVDQENHENEKATTTPVLPRP